MACGPRRRSKIPFTIGSVTLGVGVRSDARVAGQAWTGDQWRIGLADHSETAIRARAIVDATGRGARIARSQGTRRRRLDRLVAAYWMLIVARRRGRRLHTVVEAVPDGWWYTTPVPGHRRVVAFLTDSDLMPRRSACTGRDWHERLAQAPHSATGWRAADAVYTAAHRFWMRPSRTLTIPRAAAG